MKTIKRVSALFSIRSLLVCCIVCFVLPVLLMGQSKNDIGDASKGSQGPTEIVRGDLDQGELGKSGRSELENRLLGLGLIGGGILVLLGLLFSYLRLDHATRGFYGGRLQLVAAIAALIVLAACYFLWSQVLFK